MTGPYQGFESNFCFFACPILGIRDNLGMKQPSNWASYLYIWGVEDAMSPLVGSKPDLMKHLTMLYPDVFHEYDFLKLVNECFSDTKTATAFGG